MILLTHHPGFTCEEKSKVGGVAVGKAGWEGRGGRVMRVPTPLSPHWDTPMVLPPPLLSRGLPYLQTGHVKPGERTDGAMGGTRVDRKTGDARGRRCG